MSLRTQLTIRFVLIVTAIIFALKLVIYVYTDYYLNNTFDRRLNNRAETIAMWLSYVDKNENDLKFLETLLSARKDKMPEEEILIFNLQNQVIFGYNKQNTAEVSLEILNQIKINERIQFSKNGFNGVGIFYKTPLHKYIVIALAKDEYSHIFLNQMRWLMFGISLISIAILSIIGWNHAQKSLEPIDKIGIELNNIFPKNINKRLSSPYSNDEVGRLSATINQLLGRVEEGFLLQKMFLGNVSHELQNPLTRITSQLEVSLLNERSSNEYQTTIKSVLEDLFDIIELTQNLLKLSQNDSNIQSILVESVRIDELIWAVRNSLLKTYPAYKVEINILSLPEDPAFLSIMGNAALLKIALLNLVQNACKFSDDNRAIVSLAVTEKDKEIKVIDYGRGIANEELKKIFQPFYRSDKTAEVKGYGIGLSIVDRIIKMHKGIISVESKVGVGTTFHLKFFA